MHIVVDLPYSLLILIVTRQSTHIRFYPSSGKLLNAYRNNNRLAVVWVCRTLPFPLNVLLVLPIEVLGDDGPNSVVGTYRYVTVSDESTTTVDNGFVHRRG